MTTKETIEELEKVHSHVKRIRLGNSRAPWLCELLRGIEALLLATKKAVERVTNSTT